MHCIIEFTRIYFSFLYICCNDLQFPDEETHSATINNIQEKQHQTLVKSGKTDFTQTIAVAYGKLSIN